MEKGTWEQFTVSEQALTPGSEDGERVFETTLRPQTFSEYVGQYRLKEQLHVCIQAALGRGEALDHAIFYGPPGLGKTTIAHVIANELGVKIRATSGVALAHAGDLAALLSTLTDREVLFVDDIHRLPRAVEEAFYPAMEDYHLDILIGKGAGARTMKLDIPPFTLIGATTQAGLLTSPLRDRFGLVHRLEFYTPQELENIITRSARILNVAIELKGAEVIAQRSRGTPRIANRILKRVRDFAQVKADSQITKLVAEEALAWIGVDPEGFDDMDQKLLLAIIDRFAGGPVGLDTLAAAISEERATLEDVYEPYLLQAGFIERTARGRIATAKAFDHFGRKSPPRQQILTEGT